MLIQIVGPRYRENRQVLRLVSDRFPNRIDNKVMIKYSYLRRPRTKKNFMAGGQISCVRKFKSSGNIIIFDYSFFFFGFLDDKTKAWPCEPFRLIVDQPP